MVFVAYASPLICNDKFHGNKEKPDMYKIEPKTSSREEHSNDKIPTNKKNVAIPIAQADRIAKMCGFNYAHRIDTECSSSEYADIECLILSSKDAEVFGYLSVIGYDSEEISKVPVFKAFIGEDYFWLPAFEGLKINVEFTSTRGIWIRSETISKFLID